MLQPNPKRRITVEKLLCHPWVVHNSSYASLKWQSVYHVEIILCKLGTISNCKLSFFQPEVVDRECALELSMYFGISVDEMITKLKLVNHFAH